VDNLEKHVGSGAASPGAETDSDMDERLCIRQAHLAGNEVSVQAPQGSSPVKPALRTQENTAR